MIQTNLLSLFLLLALLAVPAAILYVADRTALGRLVLATVRMTLQLAMLGAVLWLVYINSEAWTSALWLLAVVGLSAVFTQRRVGLKRSQLLAAIGGGLLAGTLFGALPTAYVLGASLRPAWLVPTVAVTLAAATAASIKALAVYYDTLADDGDRYERLLANGTPHYLALLPTLRRALQGVVGAATARMSMLGLVAVPTLTAGLLLGGASPARAIVSTLVLAVASLGASLVAIVTTVALADRLTFDRRGNFRSPRTSVPAATSTLALAATLLAMTACKGSPATADTAAPADSTAAPAGLFDARAAAQRKAVVEYERPAPLTDRPELILKREGYTVSYNRETRTANWVAWHLTKSHTYGKAARDQEKFTEDTDAPTPRATDADYYNSRYDRGHMCPAGDNKWSATAMTQSFLFTNICPQNHGLNKYEWNDLETLCRDWARKYEAIDIVCGPLYTSTDVKTIGRNRVRVPDAFFKVVLCRRGTPRAIGFVYRNEGKKQPMEQAVRTVDEVERLTGIDFFPALADSLERRIEAKATLADW